MDLYMRRTALSDSMAFYDALYRPRPPYDPLTTYSYDGSSVDAFAYTSLGLGLEPVPDYYFTTPSLTGSSDYMPRRRRSSSFGGASGLHYPDHSSPLTYSTPRHPTPLPPAATPFRRNSCTLPPLRDPWLPPADSALLHLPSFASLDHYYPPPLPPAPLPSYINPADIYVETELASARARSRSYSPEAALLPNPKRTKISSAQRSALERLYGDAMYPTETAVADFSNDNKLSTKAIKNWLTNRRQKGR